MKPTRDSNIKDAFALVFIWTMGSLLIAAKNIRNPRYHKIIMIFFFVYGYSVFVNGGDIERYYNTFLTFVDLSWSDYGLMLLAAYFPSYTIKVQASELFNQPDIYGTSMLFLVSRLTENPKWFFAIVSLIFSFFYTKFIGEIIPEIRWNRTRTQKIFFIFLLWLIPFHLGVTAVRFWTAFFLFAYFAMKHVKTPSRKNLIFASLSILIHFSFVLPVLLLYIYKYFKKGKLITRGLVVSAVLISVFSINASIPSYLNENSHLLGESSVKTRVESYTDDEYKIARQQGKSETNWYIQYYGVTIKYFFFIIFLLEFAGILRFSNTPFLNRLYPFYFILFIMSLITFNIGTMGRYSYIFALFSLVRYTIISGNEPSNKSILKLSYITLPILVWHIVIHLRIGLDTVDPLLLVGNPIVLFFFQSGRSLASLIF